MKKFASLKKLISLSMGTMLLASASSGLIYAQDNSNESSTSDQVSESVSEESQAASELQLALETAIDLFGTEFPEAEITEIDIELERDNTYEIQIEGHDDTSEYELEYHSGTEEVVEREIDDDDDSDQALPLDELLPIDDISAIALEEAGFGEITDWHLEHDNDTDRFVWDIEIQESNSEREAELELDALTGDVLNVELDD